MLCASSSLALSVRRLNAVRLTNLFMCKWSESRLAHAYLSLNPTALPSRPSFRNPSLTMSFRLNRSILSKKSPTRDARSSWRDSSATQSRRAYGTSHLPIFPTIDVYTPSGAYTQASSTSPSRRPDVSPPREMEFWPSPPPPPTRDRRRVQWEKWTTEVIPQLVPMFLTLLRESNNLRKIVPQDVEGCSCPPTVRNFRITVVSFKGLLPFA